MSTPAFVRAGGTLRTGGDEGRRETLRWVFSFLSADQRKSYCLFEAPTAEVVRAAARKSGRPEAVVVEVDRIDRVLAQTLPVGERPPPTPGAGITPRT
ncbi:DUF4242 domain-containing protein [Frankia sp. AgPm24]|uniref:nickel-binding protein n=1 Tax=Frankia sp. AgPm24 TaxID=631128 RepID=UPI00200DF6D1|nr:nickel-binding protein [Frankia sp. AgPm24]MCK9925359.1 DUF4242 domain-containing protein [Frankia sp. AgPm24]